MMCAEEFNSDNLGDSSTMDELTSGIGKNKKKFWIDVHNEYINDNPNSNYYQFHHLQDEIIFNKFLIIKPSHIIKH